MSESLNEQLAEAFGLAQPAAPVVVPESAPEVTPEEGQETAEAGQQEQADNVQADGEAGDSGFYITDLADDLGVDISELYGMKLKSGDGTEMTIGELKDLKQGTSEDVLVKERESIDQYRSQVMEQTRQEREQMLQQARGVAEMPEKVQGLKSELISLTQRYQSVDWGSVEKQDPGQAALLKQKFTEMYNQTQAELGQAEQAAGQQQQADRSQLMQTSNAEFARRVPGWQDNDVRSKEIDLIKVMTQRYGFTDQEVGQTIDPRLRHMLRDYAVLQAKYDGANANAKKVVGKGNAVLREAALAARTRHKTGTDEIIGKAKDTRDKRDIMAAQKALLNEAGVM